MQVTDLRTEYQRNPLGRRKSRDGTHDGKSDDRSHDARYCSHESPQQGNRGKTHGTGLGWRRTTKKNGYRHSLVHWKKRERSTLTIKISLAQICTNTKERAGINPRPL